MAKFEVIDQEVPSQLSVWTSYPGLGVEPPKNNAAVCDPDPAPALLAVFTGLTVV